MREASLFAVLSLFCSSLACADDFSKVAKKVEPSVVKIRVFWLHNEPAPHLDERTGVGVVVDSGKGYVLTAAGAVAGQVRTEVGMAGKMVSATIVGQDREKRLVLLKLVDAKVAKEARFAKNPPKIGEEVLKAGFPAAVEQEFDRPTFSAGIVANRDAFLGDNSTPFWLIDCQFGAGEDGSPLFNKKGEVVGVMMFAKMDKQYAGFTHFIASDAIVPTLAKLRNGDVKTGWLGIMSSGCVNLAAAAGDESLKSQAKGFLSRGGLGFPALKEGILIMDISDPKAAEGLKVGDAVTHFNGVKLDDARQFVRLAVETEPGEKVVLRVFRGGNKLDVKVTVSEFEWKEAAPRGLPSHPM